MSEKTTITIRTGIKLPIQGIAFSNIDVGFEMEVVYDGPNLKTHVESLQGQAQELLENHIELAKETAAKQVNNAVPTVPDKAPTGYAEPTHYGDIDPPKKAGKPGDHRLATSDQKQAIFDYVKTKGLDEKGSLMYYQKHIYKPYNVTAATSLTYKQAEDFISKTKGKK